MFGRNRPKPRVLPQGAGYALKLDERERALIRQILGDMRALLMLDVHHKGRAVVSSGSREKAELDVFRLHEYGLWATMQKDA